MPAREQQLISVQHHTLIHLVVFVCSAPFCCCCVLQACSAKVGCCRSGINGLAQSLDLLQLPVDAQALQLQLLSLFSPLTCCVYVCGLCVYEFGVSSACGVCAAYIIFSLGLTKPLQKAMFPTCFASHTECSTQLTHVQNYIQLCGIIVGEWLCAADVGRQQCSVERASCVVWRRVAQFRGLQARAQLFAWQLDRALGGVVLATALRQPTKPPCPPFAVLPLPPPTIPGMLFFGVVGDMIGRRWGSRAVATIMLSGTVLLTFAPLMPNPATYLNFYIFAATWWVLAGFGACTGMQAAGAVGQEWQQQKAFVAGLAAVAPAAQPQQ